jgi:hypothetical protein
MLTYKPITQEKDDVIEGVEVIQIKRVNKMEGEIKGFVETEEFKERIREDKRQSIDKSVQILKEAFNSSTRLPNPKRLVLLDNELKISPQVEVSKPIENKVQNKENELQISLPKVTLKRSSCCDKLTSCFKVENKNVVKLSDNSGGVFVHDRE